MGHPSFCGANYRAHPTLSFLSSILVRNANQLHASEGLISMEKHAGDTATPITIMYTAIRIGMTTRTQVRTIMSPAMATPRVAISFVC
jgi:hypothetical protein